jgi:hypothetical protein
VNDNLLPSAVPNHTRTHPVIKCYAFFIDSANNPDPYRESLNISQNLTMIYIEDSMPYSANMIEDGHILLYDVSDPLSMDEFVSDYARLTAIYDASACRIHSLGNLTTLRQIPAGFLKIRHSPGAFHVKAGFVALFGASWFVRNMIEIAQRLIQFDRIRFFPTEDDALNYLHSLIEQESAPPYGETS